MCKFITFNLNIQLSIRNTEISIILSRMVEDVVRYFRVYEFHKGPIRYPRNDQFSIVKSRTTTERGKTVQRRWMKRFPCEDRWMCMRVAWAAAVGAGIKIIKSRDARHYWATPVVVDITHAFSSPTHYTMPSPFSRPLTYCCLGQFSINFQWFEEVKKQRNDAIYTQRNGYKQAVTPRVHVNLKRGRQSEREWGEGRGEKEKGRRNCRGKIQGAVN